MKTDYYDVPMTLHVVISVQAEDEVAAKEKLYSMDDAEVVELLSEQVGFINGDFDNMTAH